MIAAMTAEADRIVRQVLGGRVDAYEELIHAYETDVRRIVLGALIHDPDAARDLVQEVFVSAYFSLSRYEIGKDFGIWVRSIARNLVRKELRRRSRETRRMDFYRSQLSRRLDDGDEADETRDARLTAAHRQCREKLPDHSKEVLDLHYGQSLKLEQVASTLGRSLEAVKQLLYRVRLLLRDCIDRRMAQA